MFEFPPADEARPPRAPPPPPVPRVRGRPLLATLLPAGLPPLLLPGPALPAAPDLRTLLFFGVLGRLLEVLQGWVFSHVVSFRI